MKYGLIGSWRVRALAAGAVLTLVAAACSGTTASGGGGGSSDRSAVDAAHPQAMLGGDGSLAKVLSSGLRICTTNEAPSNWKLDNGSWTGFDAEIANEAMSRLAITNVQYVVGPWDSMIPNLTSDRCDLLQTDVHQTAERSKIIGFTAPIFFYGDTLLVKKGNPLNVHTWDSLKGHSVGGQLGSNLVDMLNARQKAANDLGAVQTYKTWDELITDLTNGRLDVGFVDSTVAGYYLIQHPDAQVEIVSDYIPQEDLSSWTRFGTQLGAHDLANAFTRVLDEMRVDGTIATILAKYGIGKSSIQVFKGLH